MSVIDDILQAQYEIRQHSSEAKWYLSPDLEARILTCRDLLNPPSEKNLPTVCGFPYVVTPHLPADVLGILYSGPDPLHLDRPKEAEPWQFVVLKREGADVARA